MHNNRNDRETVIIPQTIIVQTKSIIVASLAVSQQDTGAVQEPSELLAVCFLHGQHPN